MMRSSFRSLFSLLALGSFVASTDASLLSRRRTTIDVKVTVRDPDQNPIEHAKVVLLLPRYGDETSSGEVFGLTDRDGVCRLSGKAEQDYEVGVEKDGYYPTVGPWRKINTKTGLKEYAEGLQVIELELRPVRKPIPSLVMDVERFKFPQLGAEIGFDMELGDWVAPHGKGTVADVLFRADGEVQSLKEYDLTLKVSFPNPHDGLIPIPAADERGSQLKFPYEAPLDGFRAVHTQRSACHGTERFYDPSVMQKTRYIVRLRSKADEMGRVTKALHGVITRINFGNDFQAGCNVSFHYSLNTDWTRNLEFDDDQKVRAGTGKLMVAK